MQMIEMLFFSLLPGYHVVNVDLYLVMNHVTEQGYHSTMICCVSVFQPKRHNLVTESPPMGDKGSFSMSSYAILIWL